MVIVIDHAVDDAIMVNTIQKCLHEMDDKLVEELVMLDLLVDIGLGNGG